MSLTEYMTLGDDFRRRSLLCVGGAMESTALTDLAETPEVVMKITRMASSNALAGPLKESDYQG